VGGAVRASWPAAVAAVVVSVPVGFVVTARLAPTLGPDDRGPDAAGPGAAVPPPDEPGGQGPDAPGPDGGPGPGAAS
jgi:hypothetical protein